MGRVSAIVVVVVVFENIVFVDEHVKFMFAIIQVGYLKYKPHVLCIEPNPLEYENGSVRCLTPFSNRNQSQLATNNKAR
jgi:hypothetical protein